MAGLGAEAVRPRLDKRRWLRKLLLNSLSWSQFSPPLRLPLSQVTGQALSQMSEEE
jgi:hypothetical protein